MHHTAFTVKFYKSAFPAVDLFQSRLVKSGTWVCEHRSNRAWHQTYYWCILITLLWICVWCLGGGLKKTNHPLSVNNNRSLYTLKKHMHVCSWCAPVTGSPTSQRGKAFLWERHPWNWMTGSPRLDRQTELQFFHHLTHTPMQEKGSEDMVGCVSVCVHVYIGGLLFASHALSPVCWLVSFQRDSDIILALLIHVLS